LAGQLNSEKFLKIQVGAFSHFLRDFAINCSPFPHSWAFACDRPTLLRIVCKESGVSAIGDLAWGTTAAFYALRNSDMSILQTLVDPKMDIGIDQYDVKRCSRVTYCLQVREVHHAKCLLGNYA
jgi:hypothetical protein